MELFGSLALEMLNCSLNKKHFDEPLPPIIKREVVVLPSTVVKKKVYKKKVVKALKVKVPKIIVKKYSMKSYETRIRALMEAHTGLAFKKRRMKEMKNPLTGKPLELDLYCEELRLGLEYQGIQHTKVIDYYHPNGQADLDEQIARDEMKVRLCKENKIALVLISFGDISECMLDVEIVALCVQRVDDAIRVRDRI